MNADERAAALWENRQRKFEMEADMRDRSLNRDYSLDDEPLPATPPQQPALTQQQRATQDWDARLQRNADAILQVTGELTGKVHRQLDSTTIALQAQIDALRDQIASLLDEIQFLRDQQERSAKSWWRK